MCHPEKISVWNGISSARRTPGKIPSHTFKTGIDISPFTSLQWKHTKQNGFFAFCQMMLAAKEVKVLRRLVGAVVSIFQPFLCRHWLQCLERERGKEFSAFSHDRDGERLLTQRRGGETRSLASDLPSFPYLPQTTENLEEQKQNQRDKILQRNMDEMPKQEKSQKVLSSVYFLKINSPCFLIHERSPYQFERRLCGWYW